MTVSICEEPCENHFGYVVTPAVYEAQWNEKIIVAKQKPESAKNVLKANIRQLIFDSLKTSGVQFPHDLADSLSTIRFNSRFENGEFVSLTKKNQSDITLFHLIKLNTSGTGHQIFLTQDELDNEVEKGNFGKLTEFKKFDNLEK